MDRFKINDLPPEILVNIFSYITNTIDIEAVTLVCKHWNEIARHGKLQGKLSKLVSYEFPRRCCVMPFFLNWKGEYSNPGFHATEVLSKTNELGKLEISSKYVPGLLHLMENAEFTELRSLCCYGYITKSDMFAKINKKCPNLQRLRFLNISLFGKDEFAEHEWLRLIELDIKFDISVPIIDRIATLPNLRTLHVTAQSNDTVKYLLRNVHVSIDLRASYLTDDAFVDLPNIPSLHKLTLSLSNVSDLSLYSIAIHAVNLTEIKIYMYGHNYGITDEGLSYMIEKCRYLKTFDCDFECILKSN